MDTDTGSGEAATLDYYPDEYDTIDLDFERGERWVQCEGSDAQAAQRGYW